MKRKMFRCACRGRLLPCDPRVRNQHYCGRRKCQQARKNERQRQKPANDPGYRADKRDSQRTWQEEKNKGYSRKYRRRHPAYVLRNRQKQKERDKCRHPSSVPRSPAATQPADLAKKDVISPFFDDNSGCYFILPADASLAEKDALMVKIVPISTG